VAADEMINGRLAIGISARAPSGGRSGRCDQSAGSGDDPAVAPAHDGIDPTEAE